MKHIVSLLVTAPMLVAARGDEPLPLGTMVLLGAMIVGVLVIRGIVLRRFARRPRRPTGGQRERRYPGESDPKDRR